MSGIGGFGGRRLAAVMGPIGAWSWGVHQLSAARATAVTSELARLGYPLLWIPEVVGSKEILAHAGMLLAGQPRLAVATGIANIYARDPMAMANGAKALGEAWPGRFVLGLGVSSERTVTLRGSSYGPPVATMRAYLDALAAAPYAGPEPEPVVPLVLAALGPHMLNLTAERADGAHPFFAPVEHTAFARRTLGADPWLAVAQPIVLTSDPAAARRTARAFAGHYVTLPHHRANLARFGFGDADLAGQGSDRLIDALVAWGDVAAVAGRVRAQLDAGADHVGLMVRTDESSDPGLAAYRELAAALVQAGATGGSASG
jgi:probable F420-dependent oxidoreductase